MAERFLKTPQSASPMAKAGAGDISERELSRERHNLQTTPPTRVLPAHPKKQLFSTPVNKFTAKSGVPSPNLQRIRSCLHEYKSRTPARTAKIAPKAVSMEDLTPMKRIKKEGNDKDLPALMSPGLHTTIEIRAAAKIERFLMLSAWRKRRDEVRCLRKTLEYQVSCSERLRIQVSTLKSLLDSDNAKVRLAMRELERLKQLVRDKDAEKAVLEREKMALEKDLCAAEDQVSELSIGWRNCRAEAESARAAVAARDHALAHERAAHAALRAQWDHTCHRLSTLEDEVSQYEVLLSSAEQEVGTLRRDTNEKQRALQEVKEQLQLEKEARERSCRECILLASRVSLAGQETTALKSMLAELRGELARLTAELDAAKKQLDWWPRSFYRLAGAARWWLRPVSARAAFLWLLSATRPC